MKAVEPTVEILTGLHAFAPATGSSCRPRAKPTPAAGCVQAHPTDLSDVGPLGLE